MSNRFHLIVLIQTGSVQIGIPHSNSNDYTCHHVATNFSTVHRFLDDEDDKDDDDNYDENDDDDEEDEEDDNACHHVSAHFVAVLCFLDDEDDKDVYVDDDDDVICW